MEYELCIREAEAQDAAALVAFLDLVGQETDFTSLDENGILMTESEMALFIEKQATSDNQITLLALLNDEIAGVLNNVYGFVTSGISFWSSKGSFGIMA